MRIKTLAFLTILLTYVLIIFGGFVASSESGMGCGPEWPLCNGQVIPLLEGDTLIEFAHRVIGAFLGLVTVILFLKIIRSNSDAATKSAAWGMIFLLIVQVLLGAVVVVLDLPSIIVSAHLLIAMFFLASLIWIWRKSSYEGSAINADKSFTNEKRKMAVFHLNAVLVLLILTLAFGAYIKHQSYGLACGWLDCGDSLLPVSIPGILQTVHRLLAAASTLYIFLLTFWSFSKKWGGALQNRFIGASLIVIAQLLIGILTVVSYIDIPWAVLHLAIGTALFAFVYEVRVLMTAENRAVQRRKLLPVDQKQYQKWN